VPFARDDQISALFNDRSHWLMRAILASIFSPVYVSLVLGIGAQIFKERFVSFLSESTTDFEMGLRLA
jgi:ABC-type dipeptide/oligopeptide/nickel transport system permease subunit